MCWRFLCWLVCLGYGQKTFSNCLAIFTLSTGIVISGPPAFLYFDGRHSSCGCLIHLFPSKKNSLCLQWPKSLSYTPVFDNFSLINLFSKFVRYLVLLTRSIYSLEHKWFATFFLVFVFQQLVILMYRVICIFK